MSYIGLLLIYEFDDASSRFPYTPLSEHPKYPTTQRLAVLLYLDANCTGLNWCRSLRMPREEFRPCFCPKCCGVLVSKRTRKRHMDSAQSGKNDHTVLGNVGVDPVGSDSGQSQSDEPPREPKRRRTVADGIMDMGEEQENQIVGYLSSVSMSYYNKNINNYYSTGRVTQTEKNLHHELRHLKTTITRILCHPRWTTTLAIRLILFDFLRETVANINYIM